MPPMDAEPRAERQSASCAETHSATGRARSSNAHGELLRSYLEFYRDLGIESLYRPAGEPTRPIPTAATALAISKPPAAPPVLPPLAPANESLLQILNDIGDCRRCRLCEGRTQIVFG